MLVKQRKQTHIQYLYAPLLSWQLILNQDLCFKFKINFIFIILLFFG